MVLCNPRDKEAAHRAEMEGIATDDRAAVVCRKCLSLLYQRDKARKTVTCPSQGMGLIRTALRYRATLSSCNGPGG
jgi:hypothetical protein